VNGICKSYHNLTQELLILCVNSVISLGVIDYEGLSSCTCQLLNETLKVLINPLRNLYYLMYIIHKTHKTIQLHDFIPDVEWLILLLCIGMSGVQISTLSEVFYGFSQSLRASAEIVPYIMP
jgi:hypothetical protein